MRTEISPERLARADWEEVLRELTHDMDPWDIDVVELVRRFREYMLRLRTLELEIPGRMLLVGAVLLRLKAEILREGNGNGKHGDGDSSEDEKEALIAAAQQAEFIPEEGVFISPELRPTVPRRPRRKITLEELKQALRAALEQEKRKRRKRPRSRPVEVPMPKGEPFSVRARRLWRKLLSLVNGKRDVPFEALLSRRDPNEVVARFMELLHLDARGMVVLSQRRFLGELVVKVPKNGHRRQGRC